MDMDRCGALIDSYPAESPLERSASLPIPGTDGKHPALRDKYGFLAVEIPGHSSDFSFAHDFADMAIGAVLVPLQQGWWTVPGAWIRLPGSAFHHVSAQRETLLSAACLSDADGCGSRAAGKMFFPSPAAMGQTCLCRHSGDIRHKRHPLLPACAFARGLHPILNHDALCPAAD